MTTSTESRLSIYTREEFLDTIRERDAYLLVGVYVLVAVLITYNVSRPPRGPDGGAGIELVPRLFPVLAMMTPLVTIGLFSASIAEKRISGSLKAILGLPVSRSTVLVGTILARSLLVSVAILSGMLAAVLLALVRHATIDILHLVGGTVLLVMIGAVFTVFAVTISSLVRSVTRAMIAGLTVWVVFAFQLWTYLPVTVLYVRHGLSLPNEMPIWVEVISALNPLVAYANLVHGLFPELGGSGFVSPPADPAVFEHPLFALGILTAWVLVTSGLATRRFRRTDL